MNFYQAIGKEEFSGERKSRNTVLKHQLKKSKKYTRFNRWSINNDKNDFCQKIILIIFI